MATIDQRVETIEKMMQEILAILKTDSPLAKEADEPKKAKESKKAKATDTKQDSDEPKKKRLPTGYLVFSNAKRQEVKASLEMAEESNNPKDVTRELARRWKALTDEEREEWNAKAKAVNSDSDE